MFIGQGRFPILTPQQANPALSGYARALQTGTNRINFQKQKALLPFAVPQEQATLLAKQLANQGTAAVLPYKGPQAAANLQGTQLKNNLQAIINQFAPEQQQAEIAQKGAMANFYNMGGGRGGVEQQSVIAEHQLISQLNPQLKGDLNKILLAETSYMEGKTTLPDGTPLAPMTPALSRAISTTILHSIPAGAGAQGIKANQSEAAIDAIQGMATQDLKPYGRTIDGISPQAIIDSFKTDDASQKRLGNFMAGNAIQFEQALLRTAMSGGPAGIKAVHELMTQSKQYIDQHYPTMSAKARLYANQRLNQYFKAILDARNRIGYSLTTLPIAQYKAQQSSATSNADPLGMR